MIYNYTVINPPTIRDVRQIPKGIEDWEAKRAVMRDEFDEILSDRMAAAIVTSMLPPDLQDIVFQNQGAGDVVYGSVKDKVLSVAASRNQQAAPTPMDIGAVNEEKIGAVEEEPEEGKEINQLGEGGKGKCYNCGGYGHMSKGCPSPQGKGYSKGDKGKGWKGYPTGGGKGEDRECYNCGKKKWQLVQGLLGKRSWPG